MKENSECKINVKIYKCIYKNMYRNSRDMEAIFLSCIFDLASFVSDAKFHQGHTYVYLVFGLNQTDRDPYRRATISYMMFGMATCHDSDLPDSQRFMTD